MHLELAPDAAVRTDRVRHALGRLVPGAGLAHVVFALEHQRTRRAYADAVAAVHAGARIERHGVLGGDPRVEATSGHRDRERVLRVGAARLDALVAQHATPVVANVQLVVDLHRLLDRLGHGRVRIVMVPGLAGVALPAGNGSIAAPNRSGSAAYSSCQRCQSSLASDVSTLEPRNSITSLRDCRTRSVSVEIFIPASAVREHAGTSTRDPSTSTTHTLQALIGVRLSA